MNIKHITKKLKPIANWLVIAGVVASLTACGGGGGSSSQMTISGTAATGLALDGAIVSASCATGNGSAVANAAGGYTVTIVDGKGPCVLTATKGTTVLRSVTPGAGLVNITPLTDMLVEYLATRAGTTSDNLLSNANSKAIIGDSSALSSAQTTLSALILADYGVTIQPDFLIATIIPLQGGTQNAADKALDDLRTKNAIGSNGKPTPVFANKVKTEAQKAPYVAATGATGATS